jgi:hypothetical protein
MSLIKAVELDSLFELCDRDGRVVMIQQRVDPENGEGKYRPWSYWSDDQWRRMEPDGPLPLWGMEHLGDNTTVFLHEGAKAARAVHRLVNPRSEEEERALAAHPWGRELQGAAHLGWIGGAPNPSRTDWSVLAAAGVTRAYIVADNDALGVAAVPKISKLLSPYPITVHAVRFDEKFTLGFDLADPFPKALYRKRLDGKSVYSGPSFRDSTRPVTWATRVHTRRHLPDADGRQRRPTPSVANSRTSGG